MDAKVDNGVWRRIVRQDHVSERMRVLTLECGHKAKIKTGLVDPDTGNRIDGSEKNFYCRRCN